MDSKLTKLAEVISPVHLLGMKSLRLTLLAVLLTLPAPAVLAADPHAVAAIAPLQWVEPDAVEYTLARIRGLGDAKEQLREVAQAGLEQMACRGLIDFRGLTAVRTGGFGYRDQFRGRSWMRPALARVVLRAHEAFRAERPTNWVTVADATQPGCGQVSYGTLVRMVEDGQSPEARADAGRVAGLNAASLDSEGPSETQRLLAQVQFLVGQPGVAEMHTAADFPLEHERFHSLNQPVLMEHRILARGESEDGEGRTVLRVATRRYALLPNPPKPRQQKRLVAAMTRSLQKLWAVGQTIRAEQVADFEPTVGQRQLWLVHKVDQKAGLQVTVLARELPGAALDPQNTVEIRLSRWNDRKPGNGNGEVRWRPTESGWQRWLMLSEAGHMTHAGGRDADISYVTADNAEHLRVRLNPIDVLGTWRWWQLLDETARAAGTPLERIFIDGKVRALFAKRLPADAKGSLLWQDIVAVAQGHDAHHHLRLASAPAEREGAALVDLFTPMAPMEDAVGVSMPGDSWIRAQAVCVAPLLPITAPQPLSTAASSRALSAPASPPPTPTISAPSPTTVIAPSTTVPSAAARGWC